MTESVCWENIERIGEALSDSDTYDGFFNIEHFSNPYFTQGFVGTFIACFFAYLGIVIFNPILLRFVSYLRSLPEKYKSPYWFALFGVLLSPLLANIMPLISYYLAIFQGEQRRFGCSLLGELCVPRHLDSCIALIPRTEFERQVFFGRMLGVVAGALLLYYVVIYRDKKIKRKNNI